MKIIKLVASVLALSALVACDGPARSDRESLAEPTPVVIPATPGATVQPSVGSPAPVTDPGMGIGGGAGAASPSPSATPSTL